MSAAFEKYKHLVTEANREPLQVQTGFDHTEAQDTWWQLTAAEADAFVIPPERFNALLWAHQRYQEMIGIISDEFSEWREEERAAFPHLFREDRLYSLDDAVNFMVEACGLPGTAATAFVCRAQVQLIRSGLMENATNAAPAWGMGPAQWEDDD